MRRSLWILALASILFVAALQPVAAQSRAYDQALGVYSGLADLETGNEPILGATFRFRIAGPPANGDTRGGGSMRGYLEPELQYIETDFDVDTIDVSGEDLMVGLNIVGVVPFGAVDTFFGGGPTYHFQELDSEIPAIDELSNDSFGLNIHSGVDVHLGEAIALTVGIRLDLLDDAIDEEQTKIFLGMRFKFD